ncbi:MAG TPA: hypothetical protein VFB43_11495 [Terracidiphilus sp.]|nr:hypothetical protein [Terracidiphilus sp.]
MTETPIRTGSPGRDGFVPARELWIACALCLIASIAAIGWSWQNGALLNYGDAVAHLHIARRFIDCRFHSIAELGSVWLPLPHLLMLPFVQVYNWWANGVAGTIPSALAYLAACIGIYRLARHWLQPPAAALALAFFALNPNLLYLQTTGMTEPLFLCEMIWTVVWLVEWRASLDDDPKRAGRLQGWIVMVLVAAVYTRYDGWIIALVAWIAIGVARLRARKLRSTSFWVCSVVLATAPALWFLYNATQFGDWLEFARGPYSAKAIELRTATHGSGPLHPGWHDSRIALQFFLKVSVLDALAGWGKLGLALSILGTAGAWVFQRRHAFTWALLLWVPVPFYAYSVAYGSVPIFIPVWWPHSWYNTRYGLEMLPAFALGLAFVAQFAISMVREFKPQWAKYAVMAISVLVAFNAWELVRERPLVYVEGTKNIGARRPFDENIPPVLRKLVAERPGGAVLMNTSVYPELVAFSGIPLRQTINESDQYIYRDALAAPAAHAAVVVAFDGDEIDQAVKAHPAGLTAAGRYTAKGQPAGTIYVSDTWRR